MAELDKIDREHVKDLLTSEGWKIIKRKLQERRDMTLNSLSTAGDFETVRKQQMRIVEIDYLLKAPHEWAKPREESQDESK